MKKSVIIVIILVLVLAGALYYFFTATRTIEVQEESPLIKDALDTMTPEMKEEFDQAVEEAQPTPEMKELMPVQATIVSQGVFKPRAHDVSGNALLIDDKGQLILRFEDFETINGPNLHIYLASSLGDDDFIDLGSIKATKGNVNYEIPSGTDINKYNKVLVWCVPFKILFSYSELS